MATDKKFSDWLTSLPVAQVAAGDLLPIVQGGVSKQAQAGTHIPILDSSGKLAADDAYQYRGVYGFDGTDWDTLTQAGIYVINQGTTGGANQPPASYKFGHLLVFHDAEGVTPGTTQIYIPHDTQSDPFIYVRQQWTGSTWSAWKTLGAYYGSNANGEYVRFADGTQICWLQETNVAVSLGSTVVQGLTIYWANRTWTFPAAFVSTPGVHILFDGDSTVERPGIEIAPPGTTSIIYSVTSLKNPTSLRYVSAFAIGRWK